MRFKLISSMILATTLAASACAFATTVTIINHTDSYVTGVLKGICSGKFGSKGIVHPQEVKKADISPLVLVCQNSNCEARTFSSKNCTGTQLAKVTINAHKGIVSITNYDEAHFKITQEGNTVQLDPVG